ncbi:MAG: sulfotransferase family protein [Gammaproteobacteria bacterium]|nr:sulfotransferase family protein [Gammaproteobacteria bacterium]
MDERLGDQSGLKVIGAGFGRNGTLSLKLALEQIGFGPCYHMLEVRRNPEHVAVWRQAAAGRSVDWATLFKDYQATVDWPSCNYWEAQLAAFPDAKVILSERDPEAWYASVMNTIYPSSAEAREKARENADPAGLASSAMVYEVIWDGVFDGRMDDRDHVIGRYLAHNERVKRLLPSDKLLVFNPAQGWSPLCEFLGCPQPDGPFPSVNSTAQFQTLVRGTDGDPASEQSSSA